MNNLPIGKGVYLHKCQPLINSYYEGDRRKATADLVENNFSNVTIKVLDGKVSYNPNFPLKEWIAELEEAGIEVWLWGYMYPKEIGIQILAIESRMDELDSDRGFIINAEKEWMNQYTPATQFCEQFKQKMNGMPLGLTTYRWPLSHQKAFPYYQFMKFVDFNQPQVYWWGAGNSGEQLIQAVKQSQAANPNVPVIPIGDAFEEYGYYPQPIEMMTFHEVVKELKLPGETWWEWRGAHRLEKDLDYLGTPAWSILQDMKWPELDEPTDPDDNIIEVVIPPGKDVKLVVPEDRQDFDIYIRRG